MSWTFPRRKPRANQVMDTRDLDDGIEPYIATLGSLNEHNFALAGGLTEADMAVDVHRRAFHVGVTHDGDQRTPVVNATQFIVRSRNTWIPVNTLTHSFTSRGGTLVVGGSMQAWRPANNTIGSLIITKSNLYAMLGVEIDGTVITEGVIGDQDSNHGGIGMEVGCEGPTFPFKVEVTVPVVAGFHVVRIVTKLKDGPLRYATNPQDLAIATNAYNRGNLHIGSRELYIIEDT